MGISLGNSRSTAAATGSAQSTFTSGGDLGSPFTYNGGIVQFTAPSSNFGSLAVGADGTPITDSAIMSAFTASPSPFVGAANVANWGTPTIYKANFTDLGQGIIDPTTQKITPRYENSPVWIVVYQNVHSPLSLNTVPHSSNNSVAGSTTTSTPANGLTVDTGDAYAVFTPSGDMIESMLFPTSQRG
jgi:hypothetical protein